MIKILNSQDFQKEVIENKKVILVDFFATWCPPCQMLTPVLEKIADSRAGYEIVKVNIDENQELAIEYGIEVVPTMLIFESGVIKEELVGFIEEEKIIEKMSKYM